MATIKGTELKAGATVKISETATNPVTAEMVILVGEEVHLGQDVFGRHWQLPFSSTREFIGL